MDSLGGLLDGPRARGAFLMRSRLDPPWALGVQDEAPLTLVACERGGAWVLPAAGGRVRLETGDVAVMRGPDPYVVADDPATAVQAVIHPGQQCTGPGGAQLVDLVHRGVRTWGNSPTGTTVLLTCTYQEQSAVSRRVLAALPAVLTVPASSSDDPLVGYLAAEVGRDGPGQSAVLDRLLDLLLVAALRSWLCRPGAPGPGWYAAQGDPVVGPALRLIHHEPARPWTLESLAAACGVSRAGLARRFHALVGEPPMAFLTDWRLTLAADLLLEPGATVGAVARQVGYGSSFALSTAFKRVRGVTPQQHRARQRATAGAST